MKLNIKDIESLKKQLNITSDCHILAIRGSVSSVYEKWLNEIEIESKEIDYESMNCSFILFKDNQMMVLQGSTVPHKKYLTKALELNGEGVNRLECGFYKCYAKGLHYPSEKTAHKALRQTRNQPVRRTADNLSFDYSDRIEIGNVHDNIHASWSKLNSKNHASAGCQVIQGYPDCVKRKNNTGHWKTFHNFIYDQEQREFNYLLVPFSWVERTINNTLKPLIVFGSDGDMVKKIQKFMRIKQDGIYGMDTYQAIIKFQTKYKLMVDGIIGSQTLGRLGNLS